MIPGAGSHQQAGFTSMLNDYSFQLVVWSDHWLIVQIMANQLDMKKDSIWKIITGRSGHV